MRWQKASEPPATMQNLINFLATLLTSTSDLPFIICSAIMKVFQAVMLVAAIATASGQESVSFLPLLSLVPLACRWPMCSAEFSSIHTDSTHEEIMRLLYDMDCLIWSRRAPVLSSQSFDILFDHYTHQFQSFSVKPHPIQGSKSGKSYSPTNSKSGKAPTTDSGKSKSGKGTPAPTTPPTNPPTNPVSIYYSFDITFPCCDVCYPLMMPYLNTSLSLSISLSNSLSRHPQLILQLILRLIQ